MSAVTQICASRQHSKDINVLVEQARANLRNDVCICDLNLALDLWVKTFGEMEHAVKSVDRIFFTKH